MPTNKKNNNKRNSIIFLGCIIQVCIHNITQKIQQQKLEQTKKTIEREVNIYIYFISENVFYMRNNKTVKWAGKYMQRASYVLRTDEINKQMRFFWRNTKWAIREQKQKNKCSADGTNI